jgi:hypothetical protein
MDNGPLYGRSEHFPVNQPPPNPPRFLRRRNEMQAAPSSRQRPGLCPWSRPSVWPKSSGKACSSLGRLTLGAETIFDGYAVVRELPVSELTSLQAGS